jgi:hypothetical protein
MRRHGLAPPCLRYVRRRADIRCAVKMSRPVTLDRICYAICDQLAPYLSGSRFWTLHYASKLVLSGYCVKPINHLCDES